METNKNRGDFTIRDEIYDAIHDDERYLGVRNRIEYLFNEAIDQNNPDVDWSDFKFKVEKWDLPIIDPMTGEYLKYFKPNTPKSNENEAIICSLSECIWGDNIAPVVQFMLDLLRKNYIEKFCFPENPLDEKPDFPELYVSRHWLERRGANHQNFPDKSETMISDLAAEAYIYNLRNVESYDGSYDSFE
jgi:hypothetical protein